MKNTQGATPGIIELFDNEARIEQYNSIYKPENKALIATQLTARMLLLKVFRDEFPSKESINFNFDQKGKLLAELKQSAVSNVDEPYLTNLAFNTINTQQQNEVPESRATGYMNAFAVNPTAMEIINIANALQKNKSAFSEDISRTPKYSADGDLLVKLNVKAEPLIVAKAVYELLVAHCGTTDSVNLENKNVIHSTQIETKRYLELCDIMIFNCFYDSILGTDKEAPPEKKKTLQILEDTFKAKGLSELVGFYWIDCSVNNVIKHSLDGKYDNGEFLEIFRKTVKPNIESWITNDAAFLRQMSELKMTKNSRK